MAFSQSAIIKFNLNLLFLRIVTSSWNVNGQQPQDENLDEWLHLLEERHENLADIYVIGYIHL